MRNGFADHRAAARRQRGGVGGLCISSRTSRSGSDAKWDHSRLRRSDQEIRGAIRSAALSYRRGRRKSLFGGLAASGWHVGSVCMKLLVADGQRQARGARARGEKAAIWGPSPGFRELRWIMPVLAGDTISFASEVELLRPSGSAPIGASCRSAIPAPISAAKWCSRFWRRPSCRGGTPVLRSPTRDEQLGFVARSAMRGCCHSAGNDFPANFF